MALEFVWRIFGQGMPPNSRAHEPAMENESLGEQQGNTLHGTRDIIDSADFNWSELAIIIGKHMCFRLFDSNYVHVGLLLSLLHRSEMTAQTGSPQLQLEYKLAAVAQSRYTAVGLRSRWPVTAGRWSATHSVSPARLQLLYQSVICRSFARVEEVEVCCHLRWFVCMFCTVLCSGLPASYRSTRNVYSRHRCVVTFLVYRWLLDCYSTVSVSDYCVSWLSSSGCIFRGLYSARHKFL